MKKLFYLVCILISFCACKKHDDTSKTDPSATINTTFNHKILDGYFVTAIAFDNLGNTWIGTFKQGLIKYNSKGFVVYNSSNSIISSTAVIYDIAVDSKNNVWIGSDALIKYDGSKFTLYNSKNTPIPEDYINSIAIDSKDNVWFTSSRFKLGGVVKYDGTNWNVYKPDNSALPVNFVRSVAIDKNDNVWLALSEVVADSYLVKISNDKWTVYTSKELGFSPYYFGNIQLDGKNRLCAAIDYSLSSQSSNQRPLAFVFDGTASTQLHYDNYTGFRSITVDNKDNIWGVSMGGYAVYNGKDWFIDDLTFKEFSVFAIEQAKDNKMWIGTGSGVYIND